MDQYIEIGLSGEVYAFNIAEIIEIIRLQNITRIPNCKAHLLGVIHLRGTILPIVSLHDIFRLPGGNLGAAARIVVVDYRGELVGMLVDRVNQVVSYPDIQDPPEKVGGVSGSFFSGIALVRNKLIGIIKSELVLME